MEVQILIRNCLRGGKNGSRTMAKVAWKVLIQPKIHRGFGWIDPLMQSRALWTKFVMGGLFPGSEPSKGMFLNQIMQLSPKTGGVLVTLSKMVVLESCANTKAGSCI